MAQFQGIDPSSIGALQSLNTQNSLENRRVITGNHHDDQTTFEGAKNSQKHLQKQNVKTMPVSISAAGFKSQNFSSPAHPGSKLAPYDSTNGGSSMQLQ